MPYFTYIATCKNNSTLYIGVTNNIERRMQEHAQREGNSFSARYNIHKLIWLETFENVEDAIVVEKRIKGWKREKKLALIKQLNPEFHDLLLHQVDSSLRSE